ncbi:MAG TPA: isoaspartyl peptidase/L-asparaginase, partial [Rhodanobacter sp.]|nr:isoaspartyl peptidase/L-asparaginase [Rhodanobacter sp.]
DKRWGRIGDSPVIGAGTYANAACAMSGTGWGEFYIRTAAAHAVCMRVAEMGETVSAATEAVINRAIPALGGSGGAIVLGADGTFALPFNTDGMYRGCMGADGGPRVGIWPHERLA